MSPVASPAVQIVDIPLAKILPNPENPRGQVPPEAAQAMAESLKEAGQKTSIKVRPLSETEKQAHPGFEYMLIGGHVRLAGAKLAGLETLRSEVGEPQSAGEELDDAVMDNQSIDMGWWRKDLAIEKRMSLPPKISQEKLAARWGCSQAKVNNALKVIRALTPASRELVTQNLSQSQGEAGENYQPLITKNKGFLITESMLLVLAGLGTPEEVEKGLRRVLDDHMTEAQVRQMVNPVKKVSNPSPQVPVDGKGTQGQVPVSGARETGRVRGAFVAGSTPTISNPEPQTSHGSSDGLKELVMSGAAGALGGFLASNLKRALGTLVRRYMLHALAALGILAYLGFHGMGNIFKPKAANSSVPPTAQTQAAPAEPQAAPVKAEASKPSPLVPVKGKGTQGQVPVSGARETGRVRGTSKKAVSAHEKVAAAPSESASIPRWAPEGLPLVKDFAERFYNVSYQSWNSDLAYLKARLTDDYAPAFQAQYYPASRKEDLQGHQEIQYFSKGQPPKVVGGQGDTTLYQVEGQITLQSRGGHNLQNLWSKPVALEIAVRHVEGMGYRVEKVSEINPQSAGQPIRPPSGAQGEQKPLGAGVQANAGDPTAKFVGDAAGEAAKKLLGL